MALNRKHFRNMIVAGVQLAALVVIAALMLVRFGTRDFTVMDFVDSPFIDKLFLLRNRIKPDQPISDEIALVGIDDVTSKKIGPFGRGVWVSRKPLVDQLIFYRNIFKPRVVAYDLLLPDFVDTNVTTEEDYWADETRVARMNKVLKLWQEEGDITDRDQQGMILGDLAKFAGYNGNVSLSHNFNSLGESGTSIILAWSVPLEGQLSQETFWTQRDILGADEDDLDEDNGLSMPYLRDIRIPLEHVHNIPDDFLFNPRQGKLPSLILRDFAKLGCINVPRDRDGIIRRYPLFMGIRYHFADAQKRIVQRKFLVPTYALLCCLEGWGINLMECHANGFRINGKPAIEVFLGKEVVIQLPKGGERRIPIDEHGRMFLDFVGDFTDFNNVPFVSASPQEITSKKVGNETVYSARDDVYERLHNKIVMVGVTETGATDIGPTPVNDKTPFVHVHMIAASNILTGTFTRKLTPPQQVLVLVILGLLLIPILFAPPRIYTTLMIGSLFAYVTVVYWMIHTHEYVLPLFGPVVYIVASFFISLFVHYITEERERRKIRGMFQTMVSPDVLNYMEDNPESFSLAGDAREATMFFSDVAGFTTISESLKPEQLVRLLNAYLTPMTDIIMEHHGYVDKYEGDAIMAEWGVPFPNEEHAVLGCYAALDQQKKLDEIRDRLKEEFGHELYVRVGLNSGKVSAGNMGSTRRFQYTVMGDAVNQAARFEPANKDYDTRIMMGESTYLLAKDKVEARLLDKIVVKGKTIPILIYELVARKGELDDDRLKVMEYYEKALKVHWHRQFDVALRILGKALELNPDDGPAQALRRRIEGYQKAPPPRSWQGEYIRTSKD